MKQEQLNEIQEKLREWCKERHLTVEMQKKGLLGNILEELAEGARANTEEEVVDAICDILVFLLNTQEKDIALSYTLSKYRTEIPFDRFSAVILDSLCWDTPERIILLCIKQLKDLGYDSYLCMLETIKEISSRSGSYNESMKKFVKNPGAYSIEI